MPEGLLQRLGLRQADEVWRVVGEVFPGHLINDRARLLVEDVLPQLNGS